jgi:hypothetical protein
VKRSAPLVVLLFSTAVFAADPVVKKAPEPARKPADTAPRQTTLAVAIQALRKEAADSWKANADWPRKEADFATDKNWAIPPEQVIQAMTRKLDPNAGIDAYIKWQLTSFGGDLAGADEETLRRISASTPKPVAQMVIREEWLANSDPARSYMVIGRQVSYVRGLSAVVGTGVAAYKPQIGVVTEGAVLDVEAMAQMRLTIVRRINVDLEDTRKDVAASNIAIHAFREKLTSLYPDTKGLRLAMQMKDVRDRLEAGDTTTLDAFDKLKADAKSAPADATISPQVRHTLLEWAQALAAMRTPVTDSVVLVGDQIKPKNSFVSLPKDELQVLIGYFQSSPPEIEIAPPAPVQ